MALLVLEASGEGAFYPARVDIKMLKKNIVPGIKDILN